MKRYLTLFTCALAFVVILVGAYTRLTDAGLGCPDWPGCYGHLQAPDVETAERLYPNQPLEVSKAHTEMLHRYLASSLGFLILCLGYWGIRDTATRTISVALIALVVFQGLLGMWTVTLRLWPVVVMGHLLGGFCTLSLLWLLTLKRWSLPSFAVHDRVLKHLSLFTLVVVVIQIALGGWTSANYAALACPDFPSCFGQYWPPQLNFSNAFDLMAGKDQLFPTLAIDNDARVTIHFTHRLWAIVVTSTILLTAYRLWKNHHRILAYLLLGVLGTQLSLGMANVLAKLPLSIAVLHNGVGALLLLVTLTVYARLQKDG